MPEQYGIEDSGTGKPPPPAPGIPAAPDPQAREKLAVPAILVIVAGALSIPGIIGVLLWNLLFAGASAMTSSGAGEAGCALLGGGFQILIGLIDMALCGFVIYGGLQLKNLGNWTMALIASILAAIPCCTVCCLIGMPGGIWAIILLLKPEIKAAFAKT